MKTFVKLPTARIGKPELILAGLRWVGPSKSSYTAALMLYAAIAHHVNEEPAYGLPQIGLAQLTYSRLMEITNISRAFVASGIGVLRELELIEVIEQGRHNVYRLAGFGETPWGKFPAKELYDSKLEHIRAFRHIGLRSKVELHALKLWYLITERRDRTQNRAFLNYDQIVEWAGIPREDVRRAISFLTAHELIDVERGRSLKRPDQISQWYCLRHIDSRIHSGTRGKAELTEMLSDLSTLGAVDLPE